MELLVILKIIAVILLAAIVGLVFYRYIRDCTLDDIRAGVYQLFLKAEHNFMYTGAGLQKMEWVVQKARSMLPVWAQFFVTEEALRNVIQLWFNGIKDLLDDGKVNKSINVEG